jgi:hypothetical protein
MMSDFSCWLFSIDIQMDALPMGKRSVQNKKSEETWLDKITNSLENISKKKKWVQMCTLKN